MKDLRDTFSSGQASFGIWLMNPGGASAEALARQGFPWIVVDLQHGSNSVEDLAHLVPAIELGGAYPLARVSWNDPAAIMRTLDLGAAGIIVPCVDTAEQARSAARAACFPPLGARSLAPPLRSWTVKLAPSERARPLCIVMIESREALAAVDAIVAVDGIDGLLLGPGDLSLDLGLPLTPDPDAAIVDAARTIARACQRHGKIAAAASFSPSATRQYLAAGMQMLIIGSDAGFVAQGARAALEQIEIFADAALDTPA